jgi:hypothetical protein
MARFNVLSARWHGRGSAAGSRPGGVAFGLPVLALVAACTGSIREAGPEPGATGGIPGDPTGGGKAPPPGPATSPATCRNDQIGLSPLRRLTQQEYSNTVRELLAEELPVAAAFSPDELAGAYPGNYFTPISEAQFTQYAGAAQAVAARAVARLPQLVPCAAGAQGQAATACATEFIRQFGRRAFRRPLDPGEIADYLALFEAGRTGGDFASGIQLVVEGLLESPHYLYLVEGPGPLSQHQLAARLSYFLWNGPPDPALSRIADEGGLRTVEALRREAARMLADRRAQDMIDDFHARWLALEDLETLEKDPAVFAGFESLRPALREEVRRFTNHVLTAGDGRLATLLTAPFTIANGPLARLYGARSAGDAWQKVDLDPSQRAGILTQAAFLATHGHEGSAPIFRGVAVREQLLCAALPPPPPGADNNLPPSSATQTTRQRMEKHRANPECASCHSLMDVLGYGFEAYDEVGRFRTTENGFPINDAGELIGTDVDGPFRGALELGRRLVQSKQVQRCLATHWFRYALARLETDLDRCALDAVLARFQAADLRIPDLLLAVIESDAFRVRRAEEGGR